MKIRFQCTEAGVHGEDGANVPRRVGRVRRLKNADATIPHQKMEEGRAVDPDKSPVFAIAEVVPVCLHNLLTMFYLVVIFIVNLFVKT